MASPSGAHANRYEYLSSLTDIRHFHDLTEDGIQDILRNYTSDNGLTLVEMGKLEDMSGLNDAFNSCICSLRVTVKTSEDERDIYNFIIKSPPKMSFIRQLHKLMRPFFNEVSWYLDLIKQLEMANGKGCLDAILPKCYYAYSSYYGASHDTNPCVRYCPWFCCIPCRPSEEGILILENIKLRSGLSYTMFDKKEPLPLEHVTLIMSELAHFHGKWIKWKYMAKKGLLKPKEEAWDWQTFESTFNTQKRIPDALYKQLAKVAKKTTINILKKRGHSENENIARCNRFFDHTALEWLKSYKTRPDSPVYTLCHGDCWSNNMLFSYNDDGSIRGMNFIDFQLINYGHPCYDLVYFIYLSTDLSFRDAHLNDVLKIYYDTFHPYLESNCTEANFTYSFDNFMEDYKWHRTVGFTTACSVMPNVLSDAQMDLEATGIFAIRELQQKQERELNDEANLSTQEIRRRITDMVHEMVRDGVIKS